MNKLKRFFLENKIVRGIVITLASLLFVYLMIVGNLMKSTKRFELNIFKSPELGKLLLVFAFLIPVALLIQYIFSKDKSQKEYKSGSLS